MAEASKLNPKPDARNEDYEMASEEISKLLDTPESAKQACKNITSDPTRMSTEKYETDDQDNHVSRKNEDASEIFELKNSNHSCTKSDLMPNPSFCMKNT